VFYTTTHFLSRAFTEIARKRLIFARFNKRFIMKKILLFGAGKSATSLIRYLVDRTAREGWQLVVAENNLALAEAKLGRASHARAVRIDVVDEPAPDALAA